MSYVLGLGRLRAGLHFVGCEMHPLRDQIEPLIPATIERPASLQTGGASYSMAGWLARANCGYSC